MVTNLKKDIDRATESAKTAKESINTLKQEVDNRLGIMENARSEGTAVKAREENLPDWDRKSAHTDSLESGNTLKVLKCSSRAVEA